MPDDPNQQDNRDRNKVAGGQDFEVDYFAKANDLSINQALDLIEKFGDDRETLERGAKKTRIRKIRARTAERALRQRKPSPSRLA